MFFSGDPSTRKRVDLGGRSSKERDRQKLLEQTRMERNRRMFYRRQSSAALKIQKFFRARRVVEAEQLKIRERFFLTYGNHCQNVDRLCFGPDSEFLRQLLFFLNAQEAGDFSVLVETCRLLQQFVQYNDMVSLLGGMDYSSNHALVDYRVKQLTFACIQAIYKNRNELKDQLLRFTDQSNISTIILLEAVSMLIEPELPWSCNIVGHLLGRNVFIMLREIILAAKDNMSAHIYTGKFSSLDPVLALIIPHLGQSPCVCRDTDPCQSFSSQILTIPFVWQHIPYTKEVFSTKVLRQQYIHRMALYMQNHASILPGDISSEFPSYGCLLGNILEAAAVSVSQPDCSFDMAVDFAAVLTFLLEELPPKFSEKRNKEYSHVCEDEMDIDFLLVQKSLNKDLEMQISSAIDPCFLLQLINVIFGRVSVALSSHGKEPDDKEVEAVGAACAFLHVTFNMFPQERIMTVLAYRTELVPVLWNFMKRCHESKKWPSFPGQLAYLFADVPGWLIPLEVFCPVYKHMLMIVDNEEFYEQEKPLSLKDINCLINILKQALWQLLWVDSTSSSASAKFVTDGNTHRRHHLVSLERRVSTMASELLSQLQDWNNRRQFMPPTSFHADGVTDSFISQAVVENTRANDILKQAPFLVPFTSRVKIFTSQLAAARQRDGSHAVFNQNRFRIRRDRILENAFDQLSSLTEEDLRGQIRVSFVNEFGAEEAGIDGGGIFKDFMENVTRASFDVQYGLFKETADRLLYPNPGSGLIHEQHLQYFHFLGTILAKAMFEGILVDIPFATFFLSKLKQKYNYLNDLPSLDPELYRHLIFLKHYNGDVSQLELYFVILSNEYGEQKEEELLPGGKNMRVTNENVITYIHLVANHRLNFQIRQQSSHFLRGFQQLILKDWIDLFNEHELQLLISGSLDGLDFDDLRSHCNYTGGYHKDHYVIEMFWEVLKSFSLEDQMKFLKFVTGCSRGPLLGFKYLEPSFCIQRAAGSASEEALDRLPTAATCMNLLKLPPYRSKEQMERKLLYAINADAGFDLS